MKKIVLFIALTLAALTLHATSYYISPSGNDKNNGTSKATSLASLATVQKKVKAGDVINILPGTYRIKESEMMDKTSSKVWDIIFDFSTSGTENAPIIYKGLIDAQGNRPVFDLSAINTGKRLTGFYIRAKHLEFSNFEVIGINVPKSSKNTQSENIRINGEATADSVTSLPTMAWESDSILQDVRIITPSATAMPTTTLTP